MKLRRNKRKEKGREQRKEQGKERRKEGGKGEEEQVPPRSEISYRLDYSSEDFGVTGTTQGQKSRPLISVPGLRGNIRGNIRETVVATGKESSHSMLSQQRERARAAASRAVSLLDEFTNLASSSFVGRLLPEILLWRASSLQILIMLEEKSDGNGGNFSVSEIEMQKARTKLQQQREDLVLTLHAAYGSATTSAVAASLLAATAACQLGWFYIEMDIRPGWRMRSSEERRSDSCLMRGRRSLHCAAAMLSKLWSVMVASGSDGGGGGGGGDDDDDKNKNKKTSDFHTLVGLTSRVLDGLAEIKKWSDVDDDGKGLSELWLLESSVRLLRFPGHRYVAHAGIACLPSPSLVNVQRSPCFRLIQNKEVEEKKKKKKKKKRAAQAMKLVDSLDIPYLRSLLCPPVKTVTLYYGNSVQKRTQAGAAWSMYVATEWSGNNEDDDTQQSDKGRGGRSLEAALMSMETKDRKRDRIKTKKSWIVHRARGASGGSSGGTGSESGGGGRDRGVHLHRNQFHRQPEWIFIVKNIQ